MRISDWSSDVCSSDLKAADNNPVPRPQALLYHPVAALHRAERDLARFGHVLGANHHHGATLRTDGHRALRNDDAVSLRAGGNASPHELSRQQKTTGVRKRSEEHTSELQSLMRISYAAFFLNKKKK